ncbi:MAG TPA: FAD-dependent oxidoreductase, partial [Saprospiraceae bacterium]|nr:FAD-dependent oxidoreductase [Saprospiraceae bacterium]
QGWDLRPAKVLAATNGFARQLLPALDVQPARNQVIITHPVPGLKVKGCFHYDRGYVYFRNVDNRILLGGARNLDFETEKTEQFGDTDLIQRALSGLMSEMILPGQKWSLDMCWSGIMGVGPEKKPIVQKWTENIAVAVRMGGMGVAIGTLVGEEGAELLI